MSNFTTIQAEVEALYVGYFMRAGDPGGTQYWINQIESGALTLAQSAASFSVQLEALGDYPFLATGTLGAPVTELGVSTYTNVYNFINQVYEDLFNRTVDAGGLAYWSAQLVANLGKPQAIGDFIINVISGAAPGGADDLTLQAKVQVAAFITNNAAAAGLTWNSTFQAESVALIAATTSAASGAGSVASQEAAWTSFVSANFPIVLTTGVDNIIITANNTTVDGTFGGAAPTYTPGDNINGGSTTGDTLSLVDQGAGGTGAPTAVAATISNIATLTIFSGEAIAANTVTSPAGFSGLTQLNLTSIDNGANADNIITAATTNISVTDAASGASGTLTVNGGLAVTISETNTDGGNAVLLSPISVGGTTPASGAVMVTATETVSNATSAPPNITINGAAGVTVNSTVNDGVALAVTTGTEAAGKAATIAVTAGSGPVVVNDTLNITSTTTIATFADAVSVSGGTTVTVNETVSTTQSATAVSSITEGAVTINGGASTTSVTVDQAAVATGAVVSTGSAAVAQVLPVTGETAQPGISAVTAITAVAPALAVAAVTTGTPTVTADGAVTITDKNHATTTTASNSITSVTLSNFSAGALITDNALSNLSLSGTGGLVTITNVATGAGLTNTTLNLSVSGLSSTTITDTNNEITTLNIATAGTTSTLAAINDSNLTAMNVSGTGVVAFAAVPSTISTLTVTGAAGFTGNISGTAVTAFDPTSSGVITATLNDATQSFTGSTGQDIITVSAAATKAIAGGSATNNEIILSGDAAIFTAASMANVTNFTTLGVEGNTSGTAEVYNMASVFKGFNAIDVISAAGGAGSDAFTNVTSGTSLKLESTVAGTGSVAAVEGSVAASLLYQVVDKNGPTDSVNVTLGSASTVAAIVDGTLMFEDANAVGIGTLNISTDVKSSVSTILTDTIGTLIDNGLANLNVSGAAGLTVTTLDEATTQATAFSIDNTSAGVVTIGAFTDANLGSLTIAGTNIVDITTLNDSGNILSVANNGGYLSQIGTLTDASLTNLSFTGTGAVDIPTLSTSAATLTLANTGTGAATVGDGGAAGFADANLTSLTLTGNVAVGLDTAAGGVPIPDTATGATTGVTISGATDNAHVNIDLTGAAVTHTDTITLGNGNDYITDGSTAGTVDVTVGTGSNLINLASGSASTYSAAVILGAHTAADIIDVGTVVASATAPNTVITGASAGDMIGIANATSFAALTATQQATVTAEASLAAAIAYVDGSSVALAAHAATMFTYGGNTYVLETVNGGAADNGTMGAGNTLVELVGIHTEGAFASHLITLAS